MAQFNVHDAKTQFSRLLDRVLEGEKVVITRNGVPVAELVPAHQCGLQVGSSIGDPNVNHESLRNNEWWKPMTEEEAAAFLEGRD